MHQVEAAFLKGYRVDREGVLYGIRYGIRGRALSPQFTRGGYQQFTFHVGTKPKHAHVHQLQAYQKFGQDMFQEGIQVRHLNGDKRDNSWDNITIGTISDNMMDVPVEVRHAKAVQGGRARSHLSVEDVLEIRRLREEEGWMYAELMVRFGIAAPTVSNIIHRDTWRDI